MAIDVKTGDTPATKKVAPAPAYKRLEAARKIKQAIDKGIVNDAILGQRFTSMVEKENPEETQGAIKLRQAGLHRLDLTLQKLSSGRTLNNYVAKSPTDVLSSLVNTVTTSNQQVLARIDLEPIIYN